MTYYGDYPTSHTAVCMTFDSFSASTGASSATSNFASSDILVYKDAGTTQRTSAAGITVSTTFDSQTGLQMVVIDLSDNTDAGFYVAGHEYQVAVADVTIDAQTVRFWLGTFSIERAGGILALIKARTPNAAAGASGGLLISGSNAGTTTLGALTVTGATTLTGNVAAAAGVTITQSSSNTAGVAVTGNGTAAGLSLTGGATGNGLSVVGGGTSGNGINVTTTSGHGINLAPVGSSKHGFVSTGGNAGTSDGIKGAAGTGGVDIRGSITGSITGNLSGSVGSIGSGGISQASYNADVPSSALRAGTAAAGAATTITLDAGASSINNFYNNTLIYITSGTGVGQSRFITGYVGSTRVATVGAWVTNPDNTSVFSILPYDSVAGATAPTVGQIATAVWQDTTASDFTTALSVGKSVMNGVSLGTGLTIASVSGSVGSVTGAVGSVTGAVGSVTGAVGSVTGNVGGNVTGSVGSVTGNVGGNVVGSVASVTGNVGGNVVGSVASVTAGVTIAASQLFVKKNTQLTSFMFKMVLSSDNVSPATGKTVTVTRSIDGAAFASATNTPATEVASGWYKITLSAADLNGTLIAFKATATACNQCDLLIVTQA